jgi:hypothetical protein
MSVHPGATPKRPRALDPIAASTHTVAALGKLHRPSAPTRRGQLAACLPSCATATRWPPPEKLVLVALCPIAAFPAPG